MQMDYSLIFNQTGFVGKHEEWEIEAMADAYKIKKWVNDHQEFGLLFGLFYLGAVYIGQKYMETRSRYNLRYSMITWSFLLAAFSIIGTVRFAIVMYHVGTEEGFHSLICSDAVPLSPISRFWGPIFVFSKFFEYVDTAFIILRKQKLIFLHWYHHLTVSLYSYWCLGSHCSGGAIFTFVNFVVHSMMYTYYAVRAAGMKVPRPIAVMITASQIFQMVIGSLSVYYVYVWGSQNLCQTSFEHILYSGVMYGSYFLLFINFFYKTYLKKRPDKTKQQQENSDLSSPKLPEQTFSFINGNTAERNGFTSSLASKTIHVDSSLRERKKIN